MTFKQAKKRMNTISESFIKHSFDEWLKREMSVTDLPLKREQLVMKFAQDIKKGSAFCKKHAPFIDEEHLYAVWIRLNIKQL